MDDKEMLQRARVNAARMSGGDPDKLRLWLDALALWPGQEDKHRTTKAPNQTTWLENGLK